MLHANNEKRETFHDWGNRTTKSRKIRTLGEKETYEYFVMLEANDIKQVKMKEKKVSQENEKKLLPTNLYYRNLIKALNKCMLLS